MCCIIFIQLIGVYMISLLNHVESGQTLDTFKSAKERYAAELSECTSFQKQCLHLDEDLSLLFCALSTTHNNKTQVPFLCQHKIWTHQAELLDSTYLENKLKDPCQEEPNILDCLSSNINTIDCILKQAPILKTKSCARVVNKIESLIFNDWQITGNFLKNCLDDVEAHDCGRIPPDPTTLSQTHTLKCLQSVELSLHPNCQSEISSLKEMKYNTLHLDKMVFAACNLDQKNFCPDEVPDSLLLYKCLVRHKYENGEYLISLFPNIY